jgi:methylmalonyl-CoA/ethylmalonyl-CoA epimerase
LPVTDVDRSEAFYEKVVGLSKLLRFGDLAFFDCAGVRPLLDEAAEVHAPSGCIYFRCADIALTKPHLIARMDDDPDGHTLTLMQEAPKGYTPPT